MDSVQDIRPFVCNECGSSFNKKWNLKVHMESHSDPFECEVCHLKFKFRHKLRSHMGRHTGIIKYNCKSCPAVFGYKRMLISHMHTHHGSPTHYCTGCGAHFSKKDDIETHGLLCLNIKKCNEEEEDCKPIVLHIAEEMARNNKKKGSEEPLFEYESCQQLQEKSKLITLQDRCNNEDIREEHYAYNKHSESRRDHESRHEEYSNLIASLTDSGDAEAVDNRNEGIDIRKNNNKVTEHLHDMNKGKDMAFSDTSSFTEERVSASMRNENSIDTHAEGQNQSEALLLKINENWQFDVDGDSNEQSTADESSISAENNSIDTPVEDQNQSETLLLESSEIGCGQFEVEGDSNEERSRGKLACFQTYADGSSISAEKTANERVSETMHNENSSDTHVEDENKEALPLESREYENSQFEVDGDSNEGRSGGKLAHTQKRAHESSMSAEKTAKCKKSIEANKGSKKQKLSMQKSSSAVNDANIQRDIAKLSQKKKIKTRFRKAKRVIHQDQGKLNRIKNGKKTENKIPSTTTVRRSKRCVSPRKAAVRMNKKKASLRKMNNSENIFFQNIELCRSSNRVNKLRSKKIQHLCQTLGNCDIRPCFVQLEKLPNGVVDSYSYLKYVRDLNYKNIFTINSKRPQSLTKQKVISNTSSTANSKCSVSKEISKATYKAGYQRLTKQGPQKKKIEKSSKSKKKRASLETNKTLFPVEDLEMTPEIVRITRKWTCILERAEHLLRLRKGIGGLKKESGLIPSDDSRTTAPSNESHMNEEENPNGSEHLNHSRSSENQEYFFNTGKVELSPARNEDVVEATLERLPIMQPTDLPNDLPEVKIEVKVEEIDVTSEFWESD